MFAFSFVFSLFVIAYHSELFSLVSYTMIRRSLARSLIRSFARTTHKHCCRFHTVLVLSALIKFNIIRTCISVFRQSIHCILLFVIATKLNILNLMKNSRPAQYGVLGFNSKQNRFSFNGNSPQSLPFSLLHFYISSLLFKSVLNVKRILLKQKFAYFTPKTRNASGLL